MKNINLSLRELEAAHIAFNENEPRDLFYRVATELIDLALCAKTSLTVTEALATLLQTWNRAYYQYTRFNNQHFLDIDKLLTTHREIIAKSRKRTIDDLSTKDQEVIKEIFRDFENILGPVGAAKCLHLLAPRFFPLWDRAIATEYGFALKRRGDNAESYWNFMNTTKNQCEGIGGEKALGRNPLKAIDEYNYCVYTKSWDLKKYLK